MSAMLVPNSMKDNEILLLKYPLTWAPVQVAEVKNNSILCGDALKICVNNKKIR